MRHGDWAWSAIAAGVVAYEVAAPDGELLSEAISRYRVRHPVVVTLAVCYLAAHLLRVIPGRLDPLHQLATRLGR